MPETDPPIRGSTPCHLGRYDRPGFPGPWASFRVLVFCGIFVACQTDPSITEPADRPDRPDRLDLKVEFAGCTTVLIGPVCKLRSSDDLRIWVEARPRAQIDIDIDGATQRLQARAVGHGRLYTLRARPPDRSTDAIVRVTVTDRDRRGVWRLPLRTSSRFPPLESVQERRESGEVGQAITQLETLEAAVAESLRGPVLSLRARIERERGDTEHALMLLAEAIELHTAAGRISDAIMDWGTWAYVLTHTLLHYDQARALLEDLRPWLHDYPEGQIVQGYYRGILHRDTGDLRNALRDFEEVDARVKRLDMKRWQWAVLQPWAWALQQAGRTEEAGRLLERADALTDASTPCDRASIRLNIGWHRLLAWMSARSLAQSGIRLNDLEAPLREAANLYSAHCQLPHEEANARVNLALVALLKGDPTGVRREIEIAERLAPRGEAYVQVWSAEIAGRLALIEQRAEEALAAFDQLVERGDNAASSEILWRATLGRGDALRALGRTDDAIDAYQRAEALLNVQSQAVALGQGRDTFLGDREQSAVQLVDLLLAQERFAEAMSAARRSRARLLTNLFRAATLADLSTADRDRWAAAMAIYRQERAALDAEAGDVDFLPVEELPAWEVRRQARERRLQASLDKATALIWAGDVTTELNSPKAGEVFLVYHPVREGWAGFVADAHGVEGRRLPPVDVHRSPKALVDAVLAPFASQIDQARRLVVMPYGELRAVDFHALPWRGKPLMAHVPVAYAVDAGSNRRRATRSTRGNPPRREVTEPRIPSSDLLRRSARGLTALVVADPQSDLPGARLSAQFVAKVLDEAGRWRVRHVEELDATAMRVRELLGGADLFHYAGHGRFEGRGGWESSLLLARGSRLTVGDVLALPRAPARVVLSACESARTAPSAPIETMGLAQAFIVAGGQAVVATTRPVDDTLAAAMTRALYDHGFAQYGESDRIDGVDRIDEVDGVDRVDRVDVIDVARRALLEIRRTHPGEDWATFRPLVR